MHRKSIKFRDVWVAPGSECFAALEAGDRAKASQIYERCEAERLTREGYRLIESRDMFDVWRK